MWSRLCVRIDGLTERLGRMSAWLTLAMVVVGAWNAVARYAGRFVGVDLSSNGLLEAQWYMFSVVFLLGAAWTLKNDAHVRVDALYQRLSMRGRAWVDVMGAAFLLGPFCLLGLWVSVPVAVASWSVREGSPDPGGLPRYPLKLLIPVAFFLLLLQGISQTVKNIRTIRHGCESNGAESNGAESNGAESNGANDAR